MNRGNFFTELKRRKVFKVGAAYLIVAWLAVQAASIGFPAFYAPPWALGDSDVDPIKPRAAIADAPGREASRYFIARQDIDGYNADMKTHGAPIEAYYFANLYSSKPAGHTMLRDPRVKATLVRYGFPIYWRENGWPAGCRPVGETDFECGLDTTNSK